MNTRLLIRPSRVTLRSVRERRWASQDIMDMPGAVGSFASLKQMATVISGMDKKGEVQTMSSLNFNLLPGTGNIDSTVTGTLQGFDEVGRSEVSPMPCTFTLPHELEEGTECIVHLMRENATQVVYHNLPPLLPFKKDLKKENNSTETNSTIISNWEISGGGLVEEVLGWNQVAYVTIKAITKISDEAFHYIGTVTKIINSNEDSSLYTPLTVSSFLGREELLIKSIRKRSLLIEDWDHEARLMLCWWFARKYGRNRSAILLPPNILTYLRSWQSESRFNKTELLAILHLVSYSMISNSGTSNFDGFITKEKELINPEVLSSFYTPQLLLSRAARTDFVPSDKKDLGGPLYPSMPAAAINEDSALLTSEPSNTLDDEFRKGHQLVVPIKPGKMPSNYEQWTTLPEGEKDEKMRLGTPTAFARPGLIEK